MKRIERDIGRYTVGFRHYENFYNYKMKFPDSTIEQYTEDLNSGISFEEFLKLSKTALLYECRNNPVVFYEWGFDQMLMF